MRTEPAHKNHKKREMVQYGRNMQPSNIEFDREGEEGKGGREEREREGEEIRKKDQNINQ